MTQLAQQNNNEAQRRQHETLCKFIRATMKAVSLNQANRQTYNTLVAELDCFLKYKPDSIRKLSSNRKKGRNNNEKTMNLILCF